MSISNKEFMSKFQGDKDTLSKPVFNDEEYKALLDLMNFLTVKTKLREHSHCTDEKFIDALQMVNDCLQASEYVNENHKR